MLNLARLVHLLEGRGPFLLTQDGSRRLCAAAAPNSRPSRRPLQRADSLTGQVIVENAASLQELIREAGFEPDATDNTGLALMQELKKRHGFATTNPPV